MTGKILLDLEPYECRWPVADNPEFRGRHLFCAKRKVIGKPYCEEHNKHSFIPLRPATKRSPFVNYHKK